MSCGISVIKYILFLVNIICAIAGIALIALGALVLTQAKHLQGADVKSINIIAGIIIGLGCFIFIVAFFGCCGAIRESHCMTMTYAVVLLFLLILEIAVIAYVFITNTKGGEIFDELWKHKDAGNNQDAINAIQSFSKCCGRDGVEDYFVGENRTIPNSCCHPKIVNCTAYVTNYSSGCKKILDMQYHDALFKLYPCLFFVLWLKVFLMILTCTYSFQLRPLVTTMKEFPVLKSGFGRKYVVESDCD